MKRFLSLLVVVIWATVAFAHASARVHEADIRNVFADAATPAFMRVAKAVSSGMDNELPRRFRARIGSVPGNHRILGHSWTFGDAIPKRVFERIEAKHPGSKDAFIGLWLEFSDELIGRAEKELGLDRKRAQALVALVHDVHLLGNRTADNTLVEDVLTPSEIGRNIVKQGGILLGNGSELMGEIKAGLAVAEKTYSEEPRRAEEMHAFLSRSGLAGGLKPFVSHPRSSSPFGKHLCYNAHKY